MDLTSVWLWVAVGVATLFSLVIWGACVAGTELQTMTESKADYVVADEADYADVLERVDSLARIVAAMELTKDEDAPPLAMAHVVAHSNGVHERRSTFTAWRSTDTICRCVYEHGRERYIFSFAVEGRSAGDKENEFRLAMRSASVRQEHLLTLTKTWDDFKVGEAKALELHAQVTKAEEELIALRRQYPALWPVMDVLAEKFPFLYGEEED